MRKIVAIGVLLGSLAWRNYAVYSVGYHEGYGQGLDELQGLLYQARICVWED